MESWVKLQVAGMAAVRRRILSRLARGAALCSAIRLAPIRRPLRSPRSASPDRPPPSSQCSLRRGRPPSASRPTDPPAGRARRIPSTQMSGTSRALEWRPAPSPAPSAPRRTPSRAGRSHRHLGYRARRAPERGGHRCRRPASGRGWLLPPESRSWLRLPLLAGGPAIPVNPRA